MPTWSNLKRTRSPRAGEPSRDDAGQAAQPSPRAQPRTTAPQAGQAVAVGARSRPHHGSGPVPPLARMILETIRPLLLPPCSMTPMSFTASW